MRGRVVDASALAAFLFAEPSGEEVRGIIRSGTIMAPHLLALELTSICLKKLKSHPHKRDAILESYSIFPRLGIQYFDLAHSEILALAERSRLSAYDAAYLWLAAHTSSPLVTLDADLAKAASAILHQDQVLPRRH